MRKEFLGLGLIALILISYLVISPMTPSLNVEAMNCERYSATERVFAKANDDYLKGRLSLSPRYEKSNKYRIVDGVFDAWGNNILYEIKLDGTIVFYSVGEDITKPIYIRSDQNISGKFCGN